MSNPTHLISNYIFFKMDKKCDHGAHDHQKTRITNFKQYMKHEKKPQASKELYVPQMFCFPKTAKQLFT